MTEPQWLTDALAVLTDPLGLSPSAVRHLAEMVKRNSEGFVTPGYNIDTDVSGWTFGMARFDRLTDANRHYYTDDPFIDRRDDIPLVEFLAYLQDWYWERKKQIREAV